VTGDIKYLGALLEPIPRREDWPFWAAHKGIVERGGLVDPLKLAPSDQGLCVLSVHLFRAALAACAKTNFSERFDNCTIFFVNNRALNALALESQGRRAVAVYMGALRKLWAAVRYALTLPDFVVDWFPAAPPTNLGRAALDAPAELLGYPKEGWDPERIDFLEELFLRMLDFVLHHELAHHARGHIDVVRTRLGVDVIDEALDFSSSASDEELRRYVEMDADDHALDIIVTCLDDEAPMAKLTLGQAHAELFRQMTAAIFVTCLFDAEHGPIERQMQTTHPPPVHRATRAVDLLYDAFGGRCHLDRQTLVDTRDEAWAAVGRFAMAIGNPVGRWHGDGFRDHSQALMEKSMKGYEQFTKDLDIANVQEEEAEKRRPKPSKARPARAGVPSRCPSR
jgi:hypothetical protein